MKKIVIFIVALFLLSACEIERWMSDDGAGGELETTAWIIDERTPGECIVWQWEYNGGIEHIQSVIDSITQWQDDITVNFWGTVGEWLLDIEKITNGQYSGLYSFNDFGTSLSIAMPVMGLVDIQTNVIGTSSFTIHADLARSPEVTIQPWENNIVVTNINSLLDDPVTVSDLPAGFSAIGEMICSNQSLVLVTTTTDGEGTTLDYNLEFMRVN